jgi:hypothetical protein
MQAFLQYDHYKVLGIDRDASPEQVKRAYRTLVKRCHPDLNPSPRAARVFRAVHEAYTVLSNEDDRARYDDRLRFYREAPPASAPTRQPRRYGTAMMRREERPARPGQRLVYYGLHLTGVVSSTVLLACILVGFTFFEWPAYVLLFCIPGMAVLPDSIDGLRSRS